MRIRIRTSQLILSTPTYSRPATFSGTVLIHSSTIQLEAVSTVKYAPRCTTSIRAENNLARATGKTVVTPGHGPVGGKTDLTMFRDVLVEVRDKVMALKKQGRSLSETVAARPGARYDAEWGQGFVSSTVFVGLVYQGV